MPHTHISEQYEAGNSYGEYYDAGPRPSSDFLAKNSVITMVLWGPQKRVITPAIRETMGQLNSALTRSVWGGGLFTTPKYDPPSLPQRRRKRRRKSNTTPTLKLHLLSASRHRIWQHFSDPPRHVHLLRLREISLSVRFRVQEI